MLKAIKRRYNKRKDEILEENKRNEKLKHQIFIAKKFWEPVAYLETIYDAQTAANALSGFINFELQKKVNEIKVKELSDFICDSIKEEKNTPIKLAILNILGVIQDEQAKDVSDLLKRFADTLASFSANKFMKQGMVELKMEDIIK